MYIGDFHVGNNASDARSGRSFRSPDPLLESPHGPYIFGQRNKIHIVNLETTMVKYQETMEYIRKLAANRGNVLFVGTKRQAREILAEEAPARRHALR